jgi:hypothetical protein
MRSLLFAVLVIALTASAAQAGTRRVGAKPLSDRAAARLVHRSAWEPRPDNADENRRVPTRAQLRHFRRRSTMPYKRRVDGRFRGTTDEIIQWAAHKQGVDGKMPWLNTVERGRPYRAGDIWGSVGAWFAGRWHTPAAEGYIARVKQVLRDRTWRAPGF